MEPAAATSEVAAAPKFLKELYRKVGWEELAAEVVIWCSYL